MISTHKSVSVVILAKEVGQAKSRLGLEQGVAARVALRLAHHTIRTVLSAKASGLVVVVTNDSTIARTATGWGAVVVPEGPRVGMNGAAEMGRDRALLERPHSPVGILVADLPRLRPQDLDRAVEEFRHNGAPMYVADHHGEGTTFLIHGPYRRPGIAFGLGSAHRHTRLGYAAARCSVPGLRVDLDTPDDLQAMVAGAPQKCRLLGCLDARASRAERVG